MTQHQLADLSTVGVRTIRDLECDRTHSPRQQTLGLLLDALRITGRRRAELEAVARAASVGVFDHAPPPAAVKPIVGRDQDVSALVRLIESGRHRLIKVTGPAGVGKTRLIQEVAHSVYTDLGVPVVSANLRQDQAEGFGDVLNGRMAAILSRGESGLDDAVAALGPGRVLLVVTGSDVGPEVEQTLRRLVERCTELSVLHEVRQWSALPDATSYPVFPLGLWCASTEEDESADPADSPALQLMGLYDRRLSTRSKSDLRTLADICCHLDGIPSALEAAASWLLLYEPDQLLSLVQADPFQLTAPAAGPSRDLRGQLLDMVDALSPDDCAILRQLARISRPWTIREAVAALDDTVSAGVAAAIHRLYVGGLLRPTEPVLRSPGESGMPRMTVLNLVRHVLGDA